MDWFTMEMWIVVCLVNVFSFFNEHNGHCVLQPKEEKDHADCQHCKEARLQG